MLLAGILIVAALVVMNRDAEAVLMGVGNVTAYNNPHNLSANSSGVRAQSETQICIFCHTPHTAITNTVLVNGPLWNHRLSDAQYTVLPKGTISNAGYGTLLSDPPSHPDGTSRMCLSCHDGTLAVGDIVSVSASEQSTGPIKMNADDCIDSTGRIKATCPSYIGTDLTNKHVVSIPMNSRLIADSLANCAVGGQTTMVRYPFDLSMVNSQASHVYLRPTNFLYDGSPGVMVNDVDGPGAFPGYAPGYYYGVQCSTCHDPHLWTDTTDPQVEGYKFLVIGFDQLCDACHKPCP